MIYFNNAATSYPKPECVKDTLNRSVNALPSGQFRSAGILDNGDIFKACRENISRLLGIKESERIYFSSGSTESLNALLTGLRIPSDKIITSVTEHNSVLRPLYNLPGIAGFPALIPCDENGCIDPELFDKEAAKGDYKAIVLNHCSNVTGAVQDIRSVGEIAKKHGLLYILDVSQSAGCLPVDADGCMADAIAFTGHKSLMGIQGTGGHYVRSGIDFKPFKYGGTGLDSSRIVYDKDLYEYEPGTQNSPGIAALLASTGFILEKGIESIHAAEKRLTEYCISSLSDISHITLTGKELTERGPVISLVSDLMPPSDLAYILQNSYDIVTRAGLHCAPLIHRYLKTDPKGTLRLSFSIFNTEEEIDILSGALRDITG